MKIGQNPGSAVRDVYVKVLLDDNRQMSGTLAHHGHLVLSRAVNEGQKLKTCGESKFLCSAHIPIKICLPIKLRYAASLVFFPFLFYFFMRKCSIILIVFDAWYKLGL